MYIAGKCNLRQYVFEQLNMSKPRDVNYCNYIREVFLFKLERNVSRFGGAGMFVEIDESIYTRQKNNAGYCPSIGSNYWKAFKDLQKAYYTHLTVNHKLNFVNPTTCANKQTI